MKKILTKIGIGLVAGLIIAGLITLFMKYILKDLWINLENKTYDIRYTLKYRDQRGNKQDVSQGVQAVSQLEDVIIVDIDERSMLADNLGVYYKWPRSVHGDLVQYLKSGNSAVTSFDIHFNDADYGAKETRRIMDIFKRMDAGKYDNLEPVIRQGVNFDSMFVYGTKQAGNVIHAMILNNENFYANKSDYIERTTEKHFENCNPKSAARMEESLIEKLPKFPVLDGAFPALAQAADRVGLVNVVADQDGIHRTLPLLDRFKNHVFPALSLQTCLKVMGKTVQDVQFVPGVHIDLGKSFYVQKEKEGDLRISYPGINEFMIRRLLANAEALKKLDQGGNIQITPKMVASKDNSGVLTFEITEGTLSFSTLRDLNGLPLEELKKMPMNQPTPVGDATGLLRTGESEFTIVEIQNNEKTIEYVPLTTLSAITLLDGKKLMGLANGTTWTVCENLSVTRKADSLCTEYILLRGKVLKELLEKSTADLDKLPVGERLEFGEPIRIPVDETGRMRINYQGLSYITFKTVSYYDVWAKRIPAEYFCGKIFLVGSAAVSMGDIVNAPVGAAYPGVEIHATAITDILNNNFMHTPSPWVMMLIVIGLCVLIAVTSLLTKPFIAAPILVVSMLGYFVVCMTNFDKNLDLEIIKPVFGMVASFIFALIYRYITEEKDKKFLKATFANYLSPELIDQMYNSKTFPELGGEESLCTAFFTDIQGFSTFSEKLGSASRIVELLNEYLSGMTDILMENGGTLDKYIGDAIVAIFGAPMPLSDHAEKAVRTAIGMQNKLGELRTKWKSEGDKWPEIVHVMRMRIGINTGTIVTGNMGSKKRMNYTMMGDPVNLAARLESASKQYGVFTMISDATMALVQGKFESRTLDKIVVIGKSEPVTVYEILAEKGKAEPQAIEIFQTFEAGLELYRKQEWDKAITLFTENAHHEKEWRPDQKTNPSKLYISRCEQFKLTPPGADWDGVYKLTSK